MLGCLRDDYFILDTHPVPDFMVGDGNGLLTVFSGSGCESKQHLCSWLWKHLALAKVGEEEAQSLSIIVQLIAGNHTQLNAIYPVNRNNHGTFRCYV